MELLVYPLISALASLAIAHYNVLPRWIYKTILMRNKPFSCVTCLSFWIGVTMPIPLLDLSTYYLLPIMGLASSSISIQVLKTEQ